MNDEIINLRGQSHVVTECIHCGICFTVPKVSFEYQRKAGGFHHCPNGHNQGWNKEGCENANLRRDRDRLAQQIAQRDDEIAEQQKQRRAAELKLKKAEEEARRIARRTSNGVCPDCNRTFQNVARHRASKHRPKLVCVA